MLEKGNQLMETQLRLRPVVAFTCLLVMYLFISLYTGMAHAIPMQIVEAAEKEAETDPLPSASNITCDIVENGDYIDVKITNTGAVDLEINSVFLGYEGDMPQTSNLPSHFNVTPISQVDFVMEQQDPAIPDTTLKPPKVICHAKVENGCPHGKLKAGEHIVIHFDVAASSDTDNGLPPERLVFGLHAKPVEAQGDDSASWYISGPVQKASTLMEPTTLALLGLGFAGMLIRQSKRIIRN